MLRYRSLALAAWALTACVALAGFVHPASANWLTHILKEAGEAGGKAGTHAHPNLGAVGKAAKHLGDLADAPKGALAAHATPEGHWKFVNREGETFTAGTADEFKRVGSTLAPDAGEGKLTLYLSEDSVFANRQHLDKLPENADLHVVTNHGAFPVARGGSGALTLKMKPNLSIDLADRELFEETLSYLSRPLNKSGIRMIALEPSGSKLLSAAPRFDAATKAALVDKLDPAHLDRAFSGIRGQTAVVVGRIDNGKLFFKPQSGAEMIRDLDDIYAAARQNDVNLVLLHAETPLQPGGRNWLWQKVELGGFEDAISGKTFGDFLDALAARRAPMSISATREGQGRVRISALADEGSAISSVKPSMSDIIGHVTGEVVTKAAEIHVRDEFEPIGTRRTAHFRYSDVYPDSVLDQYCSWHPRLGRVACVVEADLGPSRAARGAGPDGTLGEKCTELACLYLAISACCRDAGVCLVCHEAVLGLSYGAVPVDLE